MADSQRDLVRRRAGNRCEYCLLPDVADEWPFHVDHVVPRQHGGGDDLDNLCWSCSRCNLSKGPNISSLDLQSPQPVPLFSPRTDRWGEHFATHEGRIVGLTPTDRVTVKLLAMNVSSRVELRRKLKELGDF